MKVSRTLFRLFTRVSLLCSFSVLSAESFSMDCLKSTGAYASSSNINLSYHLGKGIGYHTNYSTLNAFFLTPESYCNYYSFIDCRLHYLENGKNAVNIGVGSRIPMIGSNDIVGVSFYYDYRQTHHQNFNQFGISAEYLSDSFDVRFNGYIPEGKRKSKTFDHVRNVTDNTQFVRFSNHSILIKGLGIDQYEKAEYSFYGGDIEIGKQLIQRQEITVYGAAGAYLYTAKYGKTFLGGSARILGSITEYLSLEANANYDSVFKTTASGIVTLTYPFGPSPKLTRCRRNARVRTIERLVTPVRRQEIIPTKTHSHHRFIQEEDVQAINPATGVPYNVVFVNNTTSGAGAGSFEDPFSSLSGAQGGSKTDDILYIYPGDHTFNGMDTGISLKDNQQLYGSGRDITLESQFGLLTIPAQTDRNPAITNKTGSAITLANNTIVEGFLILEPAEYGIHGTEIDRAQIRHNSINNPEFSGIFLENCTGKLSIEHNVINYPNINNFGSNINVLNSGTTSCNVSIHKNTLNTDFIGIQLFSLDQSAIVSSICENIITGTDTAALGIVSTAFNDSYQKTSIHRNEVREIEGFGGVGIAVISTRFAFTPPTTFSLIESTIIDNTVSRTTQEGISIGAFNGGHQASTVIGNKLTETGASGVFARTSIIPGGDFLCLELKDNQSDTGYLLTNFTGAVYTNTFDLEPLVNNIGNVTLNGDITEVPSGTCNQ